MEEEQENETKIKKRQARSARSKGRAAQGVGTSERKQTRTEITGKKVTVTIRKLLAKFKGKSLV